MELKFHIVTGSTVPIYRQLVDQVRRAVAGGVAQPGQQVPSVRALAEFLVVNPNTVARAYADLVQDGVLEARAGKGVFVAPRRQRLSDGERQRRLDAAVEAFLSETALLDFSATELLARLQSALAQLEGRADAPDTKEPHRG